jgi:hypothetical protein
MELIALLSTGKGSWGQVAGLMRKGEWQKIIVLGAAFAKEFSVNDVPFDFVEYDPDMSLMQEMEVAVSIASGNGKEHMALLSALLSIPVGIRFSALTKDGIVIF